MAEKPAQALRLPLAYLFAVLVAAVTLLAFARFAPDPAAFGLAAIAPDRILVMEPGEQHQARHPASANWALEFPDQFRFDAETANQRAAHVGTRDVSAAERQWHFNLTDQEAARPDLALFIPHAAGDLVVHVNGARTADGSGLPRYFGPGIGRTTLAAPLAARDLHVGLNRFDVIQSEDPQRIGIRAIYLGTAGQVAAAQSAFERWLDWQRLAAGTAAVAGLLGALLLALVGQQRIPAAAFAFLTVGQVLDLAPVSAALPLLASFKVGATIAASGVVIWCRRHPRDWTGWLLLGLAMSALLGGLAALVLTAGLWSVPSPYVVLQLANNAARPLLLIGAPISIWRDGKVMMERLRQARSDGLRKDRIIASQQQALDIEIRNAAILEERQRFARDMHDGIGGHLQGLLMRVRANRIASGDIASELQSGLADLRLMVDSLDQIETNLYAALENFRVRAGPQLTAAGIALDWQLGEAVRNVALDPRATLSLFRLLQEVVSNCIRHAGARTLRIGIDLEPGPGMLIAELADDGCGFDPVAAQRGKGLANLRQRGIKLGGSTDVTSSPGAGTCVRIRVPVKPAGS